MLRGKSFSFLTRQTLCLWIGKRHIRWGLLTGRGAEWQELGATAIPMTDDGSGSPDVAALCAALQELPGQPPQKGLELRVVIKDQWLSVAAIPWSEALRRKDTAIDFARECLSAFGFKLSADDTIYLDDAPYDAPRLAVAYPEAILQAIGECARRWQAHWRSLRPVSVLAWRSMSRKTPLQAMAITAEDHVTLLLANPKRQFLRLPALQEIKTLVRLPQDSPAETLELAWKRLGLRQPQTLAIQTVLTLDASDEGEKLGELSPPFVLPDDNWQNMQANERWIGANSGSCALDAHTRPHRPGFTHWIILLLAVIFLGSLISGSWTFYQRAERAKIAYEDLQQKMKPPAPIVWKRKDLMRISAVNIAIKQLNLPIEAVLQALRPPRDIRVAVLQVETSVATNERNAGNILRITAEGLSSSEMARYVAFVSERRPFVRAYLTHHEVTGSGNNQRFRFSMEAEWND